jgi:hypothetical protein
MKGGQINVWWKRLSTKDRSVDRPIIDKYMHTVKRRLAVFPSPAGMSLTKLSLAVNY